MDTEWDGFGPPPADYVAPRGTTEWQIAARRRIKFIRAWQQHQRYMDLLERDMAASKAAH